MAFVMLTFTIPIGWYSLACCYIVLCFLILLKLFFCLKFFVFFSHFLNDQIGWSFTTESSFGIKGFSKVEIPTTIPQCKVSSCNNGVFPNGPYLPSL